MKKTFICSIYAALIILSGNSVAQTASSDTIYVDVNATGNNNGTSWTDAFTHVDSLNYVNVVNVEVWIAQGTYTPKSTSSFITVTDGWRFYGGFQGFETARNQRSPIQFPTILSGDINQDDASNVSYAEPSRADNCETVVRMYAVGNNTSSIRPALLDGFIIRDGNAASSNAGPGRYGAGIYIQSDGTSSISSYALVRNCIIERNAAIYNAAVYVLTNWNQYHITAVFENCIVRNNFAEGTPGIGNFSFRGICFSLLTNCLVYDNTAVSGAIMTVGTWDVLYNNTIWPVGQVYLNTTIANNNASSSAPLISTHSKHGINHPDSSAPSVVTGLNSILMTGGSLLTNNHGIGYVDTSSFKNCLLSTTNNGGNSSPLVFENCQVTSNPMFFNSSANNYYLQAGSSGINSGLVSIYDSLYQIIGFNPPTVDLGGAQRYANGATNMEMGPYQYNATASIDENSSMNMTLYPNPAQLAFSLTNLQNAYIENLTIHNLAGQLVKVFGNQPGNYYDVSDLGTGQYIVSGLANGKHFSTQLVKK